MTFRGNVVAMMPAGGIDNNQGSQNIDNAKCADAQNVRFWRSDVVQRGGFAGYLLDGGGAPIAVSAGAVTGVHTATYSNGVQVTAFGANTVLAKDNGAGGYANVKTGLTASANNYFAFAELNDLTIAINGVDVPFKFSDSVAGTNLVGTPPAHAKAILSYFNRILMGNMGGASSGLVQWCALNNQDDWTSDTAGSATPQLKAGQYITAMAANGTDAFLFYNRSIWEIHYTADSTKPFAFTVKDPTVGAVSQGGVVVLPNESGMLFVSQRGIYRMRAPDYTPVRVSKDIDGTWATLNKTRLPYVSAALYPAFNEAWFSVSTGSSSTHDLVLVYDYERDAWTKFAIAANALGNWIDSTGETRILHGDTSGVPFIDESGTSDNGVAIDAFVTSKNYVLVDGIRKARVSRIEVDIDGQPAGSTLEINYGYDLQGLSRQSTVSQAITGAVWDTARFDADSWVSEEQITRRIYSKGDGTRFQWQIRNRIKDQIFRLYQFRIGVIPEGLPKEEAA